MTTTQRGLLGRITIRYPRLVVGFGWIVVLGAAAATFGLFYAIIWIIMAVAPSLGDVWR